MPTLHGVLLSPFVRKARIGLIEKGIEHDINPVMPIAPHNTGSEFRKMSPLGKIPALEDGDFSISDSSVILNYLDKKHPSPALLPAAAEDCARALWFEELGDTKLIEAIGPVFFNRVVAPNVLNQPSDEDAIAAGLAALPPLFDYLEGQIGEGDYLVGGTFSVADISIGSMLRQFQIAGESVDASRWPKLAAYADRTLERPSFKSAIAAENELFQSMAS